MNDLPLQRQLKLQKLEGSVGSKKFFSGNRWAYIEGERGNMRQRAREKQYKCRGQPSVCIYMVQFSTSIQRARAQSDVQYPAHNAPRRLQTVAPTKRKRNSDGRRGVESFCTRGATLFASEVSVSDACYNPRRLYYCCWPAILRLSIVLKVRRPFLIHYIFQKSKRKQK